MGTWLIYTAVLAVAYCLLVVAINSRAPHRLDGKNMLIGIGLVFFCGYFGLIYMGWLLIKKPEAWPVDKPQNNQNQAAQQPTVPGNTP